MAALALCAAGLLIASCAPAPDGAATPVRSGSVLPVAHWRALFDADAPEIDAQAQRLSRSPDSSDFYPLAYPIDGMAGMFEATGDLDYARRALSYAENMIASARPSAALPSSSFADGFLGWVARDNAGDETPLYESYAWRYVTRLLRVLRPNLGAAPPAMRASYDRVLAFTERNIVDKWLARGPDAHIYRSRTHMAAHWASIALDVSVLTADPNRRAQCLEIVHAIDDHLPNYPSSLRGQLRPHRADPGAYWWSDVWGETAGHGQDVGHGNGVIAYVVEARDLGAGWSRDELLRFARTLTGIVLRPGTDHPRYVDGTGRGNGWIADGFVKLGRYSPAVQLDLQDYDVQNSQYYAAMAVNAKLLGAGGG
jgi:hypothetical protein